MDEVFFSWTKKLISKKIGLRCDIDFGIGLKQGIPFILKALKDRNINATFYVTMGPDGFAKHANRLGSSSYRARIRRMNPLNIIKKFGFQYLIKQAIGISSNVGADYPNGLKNIIRGGHELGVHGYDHHWWAENVLSAEKKTLALEIHKGIESFKSITGIMPSTWASPNWRCNENVFSILENFPFSYGADTRGDRPFRPKFGVAVYRPQIPISMPCLHEISDYLDTKNEEKIINEFKNNLKNDYNVWCIHDYYEGLLQQQLFIKLLDELIKDEWEFVPILSIANELDPKKLDTCQVVTKSIRGGRGHISCIGDLSA